MQQRSKASKGVKRRTESVLGDWNSLNEASRWETSARDTVSRPWSGTMRSESLAVTFPGMTVGSVQIHERDDLVAVNRWTYFRDLRLKCCGPSARAHATAKRGPRRGCVSPTTTARKVVFRLQSGGERCRLRSQFESVEMPSWRSNDAQKPGIAILR